MTLDPLDTADSPTEFSIHFEKGVSVKVILGDQEATDSVELFKLLNKIGHDNGVGRIDIVETRLVGIKSRGCYDTLGLIIAYVIYLQFLSFHIWFSLSREVLHDQTYLLILSRSRLAHIDLEGLVMDSHIRELRDQFVTRAWSRQLYNGMYFSPEREFVENSVIFSQRNVTGQVRMMAYKGNVRQSPNISFR